MFSLLAQALLAYQFPRTFGIVAWNTQLSDAQ
jgi:hypothetical protein